MKNNVAIGELRESNTLSKRASGFAEKTTIRLLNKNEKGITLIALVITIIVLLILAGVTIATLTGENRNIE